MTKIPVTIGTVTVTYVLAATTAPQSYDGFGTITMQADFMEHGGKQVRLVLIDEEHLTWQTLRYGSGLYAYATESGRFDFDFEDFERDVCGLLWQRLIREER